MPRGERQACRKPGHTERALRPADGATYCLECKRAADAAHNLRTSWRRVHARYLASCELLGTAEVHFRLREAGIPLRRQP